MKPKGLICTPEEVRLWLSGKTQFRVVVTVHWHKGKRCLPYEPLCTETDGVLMVQDEYGDYHKFIDCYCPYPVGTRLFVKETYFPIHTNYKRTKGSHAGRIYKADKNNIIVFPGRDDRNEKYIGKSFKWRSSVHMPKYYSRIHLEVTEVRVERLWRMSFSDAVREGVSLPPQFSGMGMSGEAIENEISEKELYEIIIEYWNSLPRNRNHQWDTNPWVFVYDTKAIEL